MGEIRKRGGKRRKRIAEGVYRDRYGLSATVKVGTGKEGLQREKRYPFDTKLADIREWQDKMRAELRKITKRPSRATRGTLAAGTDLYGRLKRSQITAEHVRRARAQWAADKYTPKTINNRVQTLRHLYRLLDGPREPTPADDVKPLGVPDSPKVLVPADVFRTVATNLTDVKTQARFMVIASTGVRPSELKRAEPAASTSIGACGSFARARGASRGRSGSTRTCCQPGNCSSRSTLGARLTPATTRRRCTRPVGQRTLGRIRRVTASR
jgi:hypothetical protein